MTTATAPLKINWQTDLEDLKVTDVEGLGALRVTKNGTSYRWVKNASAKDLVAKGACLMKIVSTAADAFKRVLSPDAIGTGPSTCLITMPAGVPLAAIIASGSTYTGSYGWIQVEGPVKVSMRQHTLPADCNAGCVAIATTVCVTNSEWAAPTTAVIPGLTTGSAPRVVFRGVEVLDPAYGLTTGAATVSSCIVNVRCL